MSWVNQGRQEHGWFGHGTSGAAFNLDDRAEVNKLKARIFAVVELASDHIQSSGSRVRFNLDQTRSALKALAPIWASNVHLAPNTFRQTLFGDHTDPLDAYSVQRTTLALIRADTHAALQAAGAQLGDTIQAIGIPNWAGFLANAVDHAPQTRPPVAPAAFRPDEDEDKATTNDPSDPPAAGTYFPDKEGWHDYTSGPDLVCPAKLKCSRDEIADQMSRFAVPGQNPAEPVRLRSTNPVYIPGTEIRVGHVRTIITNGGLTVTNTTLKGHIFYNGEIVRTAIQDPDGSWSVITHGIGNNVIPGAADLNQETGPDIFKELDHLRAENIKIHHGP
jgi:hypothetical protein